MRGTDDHQTLDALFLSPHPDDVELFCGGTVSRLVGESRSVAIVDLTAGEKASNGSVEERHAESRIASRALGITAPRLVLGLPDAGLDADSETQLAVLLELLRSYRPRVLFAPHPWDRHPDHVAAGHLARRARALVGRGELEGPNEIQVVELLCEYPCHQAIEPSFFVDVSTQMDARRAAVAAYQSQFVRREGAVATPINHPDFLDRHEKRLRDWGRSCGAEYAEGFFTQDSPTVDPLRMRTERVSA